MAGPGAGGLDDEDVGRQRTSVQVGTISPAAGRPACSLMAIITSRVQRRQEVQRRNRCSLSPAGPLAAWRTPRRSSDDREADQFGQRREAWVVAAAVVRALAVVAVRRTSNHQHAVSCAVFSVSAGG